MLRELHIQDFTLIDQLSLSFNAGMTVLTGETGAGKSILIDALLLILGERANFQLIRHACDRCQISAVFDITHNEAAKAWLKQQALDDDPNQCIIRRSLHREGRSQAFINGQPVVLNQLKQVSEYLLTIHGQHEQQRLLQKQFQRQLVDEYGKHQALLATCRDRYQAWHAKQQQLANLQQMNTDANRIDYLHFQLDELTALELQANELAKLDQQHKTLAHADQLLQLTQQASQLLDQDNGPSMLSLLQQLEHCITNIMQVDDSAENCQELVKQTQIQLDELKHELLDYADRLESDPDSLQRVNQRLEKIHDIARKHQVAPDTLLELQTQLQTELEQLIHHGDNVLALQHELEQLKADYRLAANALSEARQKTVNALSKAITQRIRQLAMPEAYFSIALHTDDTADPNPLGQDTILFNLQSNKGHASQSLATIASGGELSRVALAIDVITAKSHAIPSIIFDEIDTGISGQTAAVLGDLLRQLAATTQVFCVTHQVQVAAKAHHHILVAKKTRANTTLTQASTLTDADRIREVARMVSGAEINDHSLKHAESLLAN